METLTRQEFSQNKITSDNMKGLIQSISAAQVTFMAAINDLINKYKELEKYTINGFKLKSIQGNAIADYISIRLNQIGMNVLRLPTKTKETIDSIKLLSNLITNNELSFSKDGVEKNPLSTVLDIAEKLIPSENSLITLTEHKARVNHILNLFANIGLNHISSNIGLNHISSDINDSQNNLVKIQRDLLNNVIDIVNITKHDEDLLTNVGKILVAKKIPNVNSDPPGCYIVNNAAPDVSDKVVNCISSLVDPATTAHNGINFDNQNMCNELGSMDIRFNNNDDYYHVILDYKPQGNKVQLKLTAKLGADIQLNINHPETPVTLSNIKSTLSAANTYVGVLRLLLDKIRNTVHFQWDKLLDDKIFMNKFIEKYTPKSLGDFLQELNAVLVGGGYSKPPNYNPLYRIARQKFTPTNDSPTRKFLANDGPSAVRFWFLRHLAKDIRDKINKKSFGGYKTSKQEKIF